MYSFSNGLLIKSIRLFLKILPIENISFYHNDISLTVKSCHLFQIIRFLKQHTHTQYHVLISITVVDFLQKCNRFELSYELLSLRFNNRIRIKVGLDELNLIDSCESLHAGANWFECEVWDMFGVYFSNHSNLKRILTDYGFEGFPLRKDFPLCGFVEIQFSELKKRIVTDSIELTQEYRTFNFKSPWGD